MRKLIKKRLLVFLLKTGSSKMTTSSDDKMCKLTCKSFSCSKRMLRIERDNGDKAFLCGLDDSECLGYMCNYAMCKERKLSDSGECLKPLKPIQTQQNKKPKGQFPSYIFMTPDDVDEKFRKKLNRKMK